MAKPIFHLIGAAGHGKTTLAQVLTGNFTVLNTDPQEADWSEVSGVILVVGTNDGFMPSTNQTLAQAQAGGVKTAVIALNKCDLVTDGEIINLVEDEARQALAAVGFDGGGCPSVALSALSALQGEANNVPELGQIIEELAGVAGSQDGSGAADPLGGPAAAAGSLGLAGQSADQSGEAANAYAADGPSSPLADAPPPLMAPAPPPFGGQGPEPGAPSQLLPSSPLPAIPPEFAAKPASEAARLGHGFNVPVRPKVKPFLDHMTTQEPVLVARSWASQQLAPEDRKLMRQRKIAQDLPEWNPMPPGEITITRNLKATADGPL